MVLRCVALPFLRVFNSHFCALRVSLVCINYSSTFCVLLALFVLLHVFFFYQIGALHLCIYACAYEFWWLCSVCRCVCFFVLGSCVRFCMGPLGPETYTPSAPVIILPIRAHPSMCGFVVHFCMHVSATSLHTTTTDALPCLLSVIQHGPKSHCTHAGP